MPRLYGRVRIANRSHNWDDTEISQLLSTFEPPASYRFPKLTPTNTPLWRRDVQDAYFNTSPCFVCKMATKSLSERSSDYVYSTLRLRQDLLSLLQDPLPLIEARPMPENIYLWYFVLTGPEGTPFAGGYYHGKIEFPEQYPWKPPAIYLLTPNGKFMTNTKICSMLWDTHWSVTWTAPKILIGFLSCMLDLDDIGHTDSILFDCAAFSEDDLQERIKRHAYNSIYFNLKNPIFCSLFPDLEIKLKGIVEQRKVETRTRRSRAKELRRMRRERAKDEAEGLPKAKDPSSYALVGASRILEKCVSIQCCTIL